MQHFAGMQMVVLPAATNPALWNQCIPSLSSHFRLWNEHGIGSQTSWHFEQGVGNSNGVDSH